MEEIIEVDVPNLGLGNSVRIGLLSIIIVDVVKYVESTKRFD